MKRIATLKWKWAVQIARITDARWTKTIMDWKPPTKTPVENDGPIKEQQAQIDSKWQMVVHKSRPIFLQIFGPPSCPLNLIPYNTRVTLSSYHLLLQSGPDL